MKTDAIAIVEAAYALEGDTESWFLRLLERAAPRLDRGFGLSASTFDPVTGSMTYVVNHGMSEKVRDALLAGSRAFQQEAVRMHRFAAPLATATQNLAMTEKEALGFRPFVEHLHPLGVRDLLGVVAAAPDGSICTLSAPLPDVRRPSKREVALWGQIATHIAAGARLRRGLPTAASSDVAEGAEAVLSSDGSLLHAERAAQGGGARESLRRAVQAIDRARSASRSEESEALALWEGLVSGRWSLVDRFDTDGRRFIVARRNDPHVRDPRALSLRERQVLAYTALGFPLKLIAYALGLSLTTVSARRLTGMRKLGVHTVADLVGLFSAAAIPAEADAPGSGPLQAAEDRDKLGP